MTMTKSRAYITEFGSEKITAWAIMQERKKYGGRPLGETYWSVHKPGRRKRVKHIVKNGTAYFSFINANDEADSDGGGESLTHQLFKEALAGLSGTRLKLGSFGEHEITIAHGETEKEMRAGDCTYYADAYWHFDSTTDLGFKWSGEMYVEVNHTHPVPSDKQENLRQARYPVVEVDIPSFLEYRVADEATNDYLEEKHVRWIQDTLRQGFLSAKVISDYSSVEYLEQQVDGLQQELSIAESKLMQVEKQRHVMSEQLRAAASIESNLKSNTAKLNSLTNQQANSIQELDSKFVSELEKTRKLSKALLDAQETIKQQTKKVNLMRWMLWGSALSILIMGIFLLHQIFFAKPKEVFVPAITPSKHEQIPAASIVSNPKKLPKQASQNK